jgi:hypothetical protein
LKPNNLIKFESQERSIFDGCQDMSDPSPQMTARKGQVKEGVKGSKIG